MSEAPFLVFFLISQTLGGSAGVLQTGGKLTAPGVQDSHRLLLEMDLVSHARWKKGSEVARHWHTDSNPFQA